MTDPELRQINEILNATPRKCLEYRTPAEVFRECLLQMAG
jgi:IS30 family transposase